MESVGHCVEATFLFEHISLLMSWLKICDHVVACLKNGIELQLADQNNRLQCLSNGFSAIFRQRHMNVVNSKKEINYPIFQSINPIKQKYVYIYINIHINIIYMKQTTNTTD